VVLEFELRASVGKLRYFAGSFNGNSVVGGYKVLRVIDMRDNRTYLKVSLRS
jgi:hypothetical protein